MHKPDMQRPPSRLRELVAPLNAGRATDSRRFSPERPFYGAHEILRPGDAYYWDGQKRNADPLRPHFVFQYTLSGWGVYESAGKSARIDADSAFMATVPSAHRYYLPPESPGWEYFWLIVRHPYAVSRCIDLKRRHGAVFDLSENEAVALRLLRLFEGGLLMRFRDTFAEEQALFEFVLELERFAHHQVFPRHEREQIQEKVRAYVRGEIGRQVDIAEIARLMGMTRSNFSHHFKAITGQSPAAFVRQIRLEEASQHLASTETRLEDIAAATGFASANDLCKVFRRHYQITPGEFRRQMRTG